MKTKKLVILSTWDNPELPYLIEMCQRQKVRIHAVVCAGKMEEREKHIILDRTEGFFKTKDFFSIAISTIPFYFVKSHASDDCKELLKMINADVLINGGTPNILRKDILDIPRLGVLNAHPGRIPDYRGCTCVEWAIYNNDPIETTCHFMGSEIDRGPILIRRRLRVKKGWRYPRIRSEVIFNNFQALIQGIKKAYKINRNYKDLPFPEKGRYYGVIDKDKMKDVLRKIEGARYS